MAAKTTGFDLTLSDVVSAGRPRPTEELEQPALENCYGLIIGHRQCGRE